MRVFQLFETEYRGELCRSNKSGHLTRFVASQLYRQTILDILQPMFTCFNSGHIRTCIEMYFFSKSR